MTSQKKNKNKKNYTTTIATERSKRKNREKKKKSSWLDRFLLINEIKARKKKLQQIQYK